MKNCEQEATGETDPPTNITEINTRMMELDGRSVKVRSGLFLPRYAAEMSLSGEVEVLVTSRVRLELYGQNLYPASTIYTDGKVEQIMPAFLTQIYRGYKSDSDQLVISGNVTYIAWHTDIPSDASYLPLDSHSRPFKEHLVTTRSQSEKLEKS